MKKSRHIFAIVFVSVLIGVNVTASAQVNIWEGISCQKKVALTPYPANTSSNAQFSTSGTRPAIIICPGGSYFWHESVQEVVIFGMTWKRKVMKWPVGCNSRE